MDFKSLLEIAKKAGEESIKRENSCKYHSPIKIWIRNKKEYGKCKCGLIAIMNAKIWSKNHDS